MSIFRKIRTRLIPFIRSTFSEPFGTPFGPPFGEGAGGGGFTPKDLPDLGLWLRSDLGVVLIFGRVSTWHDQSGNARDATQTNPSNQPPFVHTSTINSLPALRCEDQYMDVDLTFLNASSFSIFAVVNRSSNKLLNFLYVNTIMNN